MNPLEMVVLIVAIVMVATIFIKRMELGKNPPSQTDSENQRLRQQVTALQQRINTLERIVTDRGVQTAAQIEALRERDNVGAEDEA
jgi:uncharacterized protein YlxW (UPF0749 family)